MSAVPRKPRQHSTKRRGRLYRSPRGWWGADLREVGLGRQLLRDPTHPDWTPDHDTSLPAGRCGEFTTDESVAAGWYADYVRAMRGAVVRRQMGIAPPAPARRMADEVEDYLAQRAPHVERQTRFGIQTALRSLEKLFGPDADPARLTARDVQRWVDVLLDPEGEHEKARSTVGQYLTAVRGFLKRYGADPAAGVELPRAVQSVRHGWDEAQVRRVRAAADAVERSGRFRVPARLATELALCTGARIGELFAIRWERIEERYRRVWITEQAVRTEGRLRHTKGKKDRFALLHPDWWDHHRAGQAGLVLSLDGHPVMQSEQRGVLVEVMRQAGLKAEGEANHMFRHTYARRFLEGCGERGVNGLPLLQIYLGHARITTTEGSYGHYGAGVRHEHALRVFYPTNSPRLEVVA